MSFETEKLAELAGKLPAHAGAATYRPPAAPAHVYLLAEHLDTVLAAGEDLMGETFTWNTANPNVADDVRRERLSLAEAFSRVRTLELTLIARLMRAREHTQTLKRNQPRLRLVTQLFLAGTTPFVDAVAEMGDTTRLDFETGDVRMAYLRSRGLIDTEDAAPIDGARLPIGDDFLIANRIALGVLMDLVAHVLDALEVHYELFGDAPSPFAQRAEPATPIAEATPPVEPVTGAEPLATEEAIPGAAPTPAAGIVAAAEAETVTAEKDVGANAETAAAGNAEDKAVEAGVKGLSLTEAIASLAPAPDSAPVASLSDDAAEPVVETKPAAKAVNEATEPEPPAETPPAAAKSA